MNDLRTAAQQALEAICGAKLCEFNSMSSRHEMVRLLDEAITTLRAALAEPEGGGNLPPPFPVKFDHAIGADRFKVVRGAFWWHVLIGDSPTEHGKFRSRASAEKMAADLLREFRNGAFVQHEAALAEPMLNPAPGYCKHCKQYTIEEPLPAEPVQEPVASIYITPEGEREFDDWRCDLPVGRTELYAAPPQRKPLTEEEIAIALSGVLGIPHEIKVELAREVERAHGIGEKE